MIKIYRFRIEYYDLDNDIRVATGNVMGATYGAAMDKLTSYYIEPKDDADPIIEVRMYEVESYNHSILFDHDIEDTRKAGGPF